MSSRRKGLPGKSLRLFAGGLLALLLVCGGLFVVPHTGVAAAIGVAHQQCANQPDGLGPCDWVTGNVNEAKAQYFEGDAVPYRVVLEGLSPSTQYWISFGWDTTKSAKHALDYLVTYNYSESFADACGGWGGGVGPVTCSTSSTYAVPVDPLVSAAGVTQVAGVFTLWNGTIDSVGSNSPNFDDNLYSYIGDYTGTSSALITVKFTTGAGQTDVVLAYGGHIATQIDWGAGNSAVNITGSPYHAFLNDASWGSTGSKDLQLSASAVVAPGSITVIKDATPDDPQDFGFSLTGTDVSESFTLDDAVPDDGDAYTNSATYTDLAPGDFTVTESVPAGWSLDSIDCGSASVTPVTDGVTIALAEGEDVTCTFYDSLLLGTLRVIKDVVNDNGGTATASNFSLHVKSGGVDVVGSPAPGSASGTVYTLLAGDYVVSEDAPLSGYSQTGFSGDCDGSGNVTVVAGLERSCTITNDDIAPTLTLTKTVVNDNGGTLTMANFPAYIDAGPASWGVAYEVQANVQHTASEDEQDGYAASPWGGDCGDDGTITLLPGENKTCSITNDDIAPTLTLTKTVVNDDGGDLNLANFPAFIDGASATWGVAYDVQANVQHTITETQQTGYAASAWGTDCAANGTITLLPGENKTCSITNDDVTASLTLVKTVINDNGGNLQVGDFPLFIDGTPATSGVSYPVQANVQLTVSETQQSGYTASAWGTDCAADGTITLLPGENKTCTITNNDVAPTLTLVKTVINNSGGNLLVGDFPLFIDGTPATSGVSYPVQANVQYTASETQQPGYTASAWGTDCAADGTITLLPGENKTCTITNNDDPAYLIVIKHVVNDDGGSASAGDFTMTIGGVTVVGPSSFAGEESPGTTKQVYPGAYNVTESGPAGYSAGYSADCSGSIALGQTKTCTVTNDDQPAYLTVIKHVVNDDGWSYVASDFTMTINGVTVPAGASFAGAESPGVTRQVYPGSYNVTESGPVPYAASYSADCTGSIALGESKSCTVTNNDLEISIDIEKWTNGQDADAPIGPYVHKGDPINWTYKVTNTSDVTLTSVAVTDSQGVTVSCPKTTLGVGEMMTCTASGTAIEGQYANLGTAEGYYEGIKTSDSDPSHYSGIDPCIDLVKLGPTGAKIGDNITYVFRVTNCSASTPLDNVKLSDPRFPAMGVVDIGHLDPGQSKEHVYVYTVKESDGTEIINVATATGEDPLEKVVDDTDDWFVPIKPKEVPPEFVPEWSSLALLASGLAPLAGYARMRRRKK